MKTKLISLLLAAALMLGLLSGCGNSAAPETTAPTTVPETTAAPETTAPQAELPDLETLYNQGSKEGAYTLATLQEKKYLPFTFPELQDPNDPQGQKNLAYHKEMVAKTQPVKKLYSVFECTEDCNSTGVEKAKTLCTKENGNISLADFSALVVGSNYSISDVFVTVTDGSGAVKLENIFRAGSTHVREVAMTEGNCTWKTDAEGNRLTLCDDLAALADGNHTVTVTLQLSTGEKLTAFTGTLTA